MLVRLLYASRAAEGVDGAAVDNILEQSRRNNVERGITGVLCMYQTTDLFLQALEGSRDAVNALYAEVFGEGVSPARACVEVAALPKAARVEIDCIAVLG